MKTSEERRELTSHSMKVENVLTLLNAKYIGTPHLRFSLSPQPLHLLSVDPSDINIWFSQLLQRRSSGIEGIQEFTTVLLVPKDQDFCINARLRRVCVLDRPPGPLVYPEIFNPNVDLLKCYDYVFRAYPKGTPLDEFDIDITGVPPDFINPILEMWAITGNGHIIPIVGSLILDAAGHFVAKSADAVYKHILEIWHDSIRDEYEREVDSFTTGTGYSVGRATGTRHMFLFYRLWRYLCKW